MTEQRYSAGAMRAAERIDAAIISAATLPTNAEVATIISEETGDLALIEALEAVDRLIAKHGIGDDDDESCHVALRSRSSRPALSRAVSAAKRSRPRQS